MACRNWCTNAPADPANNSNSPESSLLVWEISVAAYSTWFINEVLNVFDRSDAPEIPAQFYIAMHSSTSSPSQAGSEITDASYARQAIAYEKVTDTKRWSSGNVIFPAASAQYTVASFSIWDSLTGGNYYGYGNLSSVVTVEAGKQISIPANKCILQMT